MVSEELKDIYSTLEQKIQSHSEEMNRLNQKIEAARKDVETAKAEMRTAAGNDDSVSYETARRKCEFAESVIAYNEDRKRALPPKAIPAGLCDELAERLVAETSRLEQEEWEKIRAAWLKLVAIHESYEDGDKLNYQIRTILRRESDGRIFFPVTPTFIPDKLEAARKVLDF